MKKTAIFYGSTGGNTKEAAEMIHREIGGDSVADIFDVSKLKDGSEFASYENLILGTSTWGDGDLQDDWYDFMEKFEKLDLSSKNVALFGMGDQEGFGHAYLNGMRTLYDAVKKQGGKLVGEWKDEGYTYESSNSVINGKFVGLALDADNQDELTTERIKEWCKGLKEILSF
ncbi:MAG: flavodoxin [Wolinella sp.]